MSRVLSIAWKDTRLRFASRSELLFFLILPVLFTALIGQFSSGEGDADRRVPVLVVNEDGGALAGDLIDTLNASTAIRAEVLPADEAASRFDDRDAPAMVTIPTGFEESLRAGQPVDLSLRTDPTNMNALVAEQGVQAAANTVGRPLSAALLSTTQAEQIRPFDGDTARAAYFDSSLAAARALTASAPQRVDATTAAENEDDNWNGYSFAAAGQLIIWVLIPLLGTASLFAFERETGTLQRLLTTATRKSSYLSGVITGQLGLGLVQMAILITVGVLVFKIDWGSAPAALAAVLVAFGLASVAMGVMLGTFVKTSSQATGISIMLGMTLGLLGGCMYPMELFPETAQQIARIFPTTWAMTALTDISMRGAGLADVLPNIGVLLVFAMVFFVIGLWRFRYE